jgi:DNA-directed RNA polymerase, omega subunit
VIYPSIDKILNTIGSKYLLVHIISKRSKQMAATGHYQMPEYKYKSKKNLGRALEEIAENLIIVKKG